MSVTGWRVWKLQDGNGPLLKSMYRPPVWPTDRPMAADCLAYGPHVYYQTGEPTAPKHPAPDEDCLCGIHAWRQPDLVDMAPWMRHSDGWREDADRLVLGRVKLWGRMVAHEKAWRAGMASVVALIGGHPHVGVGVDVGRVARRYGVPVVSWEDSAAWREAV